MKGIAHFAVGVAVASCFPEAVRTGAAGNPLYFILGGFFGLLADTVDFKFYRFFYPHDIEVVPDPRKPDPQMIADAVALAVNRAYETGKPVKIKLGTIRLGANLWQQYEIKFDVSGRRVVVSYGQAVDTGGTPMASPPVTVPSLRNNSAIKNRFEASAPLLCNIKLDYQATTTIDVLDGPVFQMEPTDDGRVIASFIPWHRKWSHNLVVGVFLALIGALIWRPLAGAVILGAYGMHIFLDQLGFMGSSFFFPFYSRRIGGLKLVHSDKAFVNFWAVWLSCLVIFWNLYYVAPWQIHYFNPLKLVFYGAIVPCGIFLILRHKLTASAK